MTALVPWTHRTMEPIGSTGAMGPIPLSCLIGPTGSVLSAVSAGVTSYPGSTRSVGSAVCGSSVGFPGSARSAGPICHTNSSGASM